jgi:hypothetical protein
MGRVSGWYKRWAQWRLLIAGAVLATVVNVNTIHIGTALYEDEPLRNVVVAQAVSAQDCPEDGSGGTPQACLQQQPTCFGTHPSRSGGSGGKRPRSVARTTRARRAGRTPRTGAYWWSQLRNGPGRTLLVLAGWLLTAVAVSFGAPFWFDALSKLGSLRTAGRRPGENRPYDVDVRDPARRP